MIAQIVACTKNGVIGKDGAMPWHLPEDLKFFKRVTMGSCLIMGRKTYESIGRPLPGRKTIVVSRQETVLDSRVIQVSSIEQALAKCQSLRDTWGDKVFIIGGGQIYEQTLDLVDRIYLTKIHQDITGDTYYPLDRLVNFSMIEDSSFSEPIPYSFQTFERN
ncbi:MAG: dihydrofolate reductase [Pseudobacteriovorax sp.]|nr:dihydrofolate reductase [Pseudobacteriovorax sp.]